MNHVLFFKLSASLTVLAVTYLGGAIPLRVAAENPRGHGILHAAGAGVLLAFACNFCLPMALFEGAGGYPPDPVEGGEFLNPSAPAGEADDGKEELLLSPKWAFFLTALAFVLLMGAQHVLQGLPMEAFLGSRERRRSIIGGGVGGVHHQIPVDEEEAALKETEMVTSAADELDEDADGAALADDGVGDMERGAPQVTTMHSNARRGQQRTRVKFDVSDRGHEGSGSVDTNAFVPDPDKQQLLISLTLIFALDMVYFFEGMDMGAHNAHSFMIWLVSIFTKFFISYAAGATILSSTSTGPGQVMEVPPGYLFMVLLLAIAHPLGVMFGYATGTDGGGAFSAMAIAVAAGALLYVATMFTLSTELTVVQDRGVKLVGMAASWATIAAFSFLT